MDTHTAAAQRACDLTVMMQLLLHYNQMTMRMAVGRLSNMLPDRVSHTGTHTNAHSRATVRPMCLTHEQCLSKLIAYQAHSLLVSDTTTKGLVT
eukprot:3975-Heterococcus_DN1.PRE.1